MPEEKQRQAQEAIQERSGTPTQLSVSSVASQSQLAEMMDRLSAAPVPTPPLPVAPPLPSLDDIRAALIKRVTPILSAIWPAEAPVDNFDIALSAQAVTLDVRYQSVRDLTPIALGLIAKQLREQLKLPTLTLDAHRAPVPRESINKKAERR